MNADNNFSDQKKKKNPAAAVTLPCRALVINFMVHFFFPHWKLKTHLHFRLFCILSVIRDCVLLVLNEGTTAD